MASDAPLLTPLGEDIWIVDGPTIDFYRIPFPTRMTVIRLANGDLFLHSPIAYTEALADELEKLGTIRHLVSPNWIHYAYIAEWQRHCADTVAWASPGVMSAPSFHTPPSQAGDTAHSGGWSPGTTQGGLGTTPGQRINTPLPSVPEGTPVASGGCRRGR